MLGSVPEKQLIRTRLRWPSAFKGEETVCWRYRCHRSGQRLSGSNCDNHNWTEVVAYDTVSRPPIMQPVSMGQCDFHHRQAENHTRGYNTWDSPSAFKDSWSRRIKKKDNKKSQFIGQRLLQYMPPLMCSQNPVWTLHWNSNHFL